jgi:hypothetical protein
MRRTTLGPLSSADLNSSMDDSRLSVSLSLSHGPGGPSRKSLGATLGAGGFKDLGASQSGAGRQSLLGGGRPSMATAGGAPGTAKKPGELRRVACPHVYRMQDWRI